MATYIKTGIARDVAAENDAEVRAMVEAIIADVRARGDGAVRDWSAKFDNWGLRRRRDQPALPTRDQRQRPPRSQPPPPYRRLRQRRFRRHSGLRPDRHHPQRPRDPCRRPCRGPGLDWQRSHADVLLPAPARSLAVYRDGPAFEIFLEPDCAAISLGVPGDAATITLSVAGRPQPLAWAVLTA